MLTPPFIAVGLAHRAWAEIGASDWLVRQLRFGLQLPWRRKPPRSARVCSYNLSPNDLGFACDEVRRWMMAGFCRRASASDLLEISRRGRVSPAFVTTTASKPRLVIDYTVVNECMEERTFRMDQLSDLAPSLRRDDCLFKADIKDAYYHLRLRKEDQLFLSFSVGGVVYVPACLNCGLSVAPWFFTKAMRPVVSYLRARGHRVFSYLDDFFGAGSTARNDHPATEDDTLRAGKDIRVLFARLGLTLHPTKSNFAGSRALEILGILVDTRRAQFLLSPEKLRKIEGAAQRLLAHARNHRRHVPARALRSFAGLGNSTGLAVVDARLRLRELFDALPPAAGRQEEMAKLERVQRSEATAHRVETWPFLLGHFFAAGPRTPQGRRRRQRRRPENFEMSIPRTSAADAAARALFSPASATPGSETCAGGQASARTHISAAPSGPRRRQQCSPTPA
jgi:hypothetical protein